MKNFLKRLWRGINYLDLLAAYLAVFFVYTFLMYLFFSDHPILVYFGNVLLIIAVLLVQKVEMWGWESLYARLKKESRFKKWLRKYLAKSRYRPTAKAGLYLFYIVCLIAGQVFYYVDDFPFLTAHRIGLLHDYFSGLYYVLILFMATDKFTQHISKESKYTEKYYAKYDEEETAE